MNTRRYVGVLGFLGFLGVQPLLRGDWLGALWLVWFVWFLYFIPPKAGYEGVSARSALNEERAAAKQAAVERVFKEIQQKGSITNNEVQALLGVSDATAERYLEELESAERIQQVGEVGKGVSYRIRQ